MKPGSKCRWLSAALSYYTINLTFLRPLPVTESSVAKISRTARKLQHDGTHQTHARRRSRLAVDAQVGEPVVQGKDATSLIHVLLTGSTLEGTKSVPSSRRSCRGDRVGQRQGQRPLVEHAVSSDRQHRHAAPVLMTMWRRRIATGQRSHAGGLKTPVARPVRRPFPEAPWSKRSSAGRCL